MSFGNQLQWCSVDPVSTCGMLVMAVSSVTAAVMVATGRVSGQDCDGALWAGSYEVTAR